MVRCVALNCKNNNNKKSGSKNVRYFRFPKDQKISGKWLKLCGNKSKSIDNARICSDHFGDEDYRLRDVLLNAEICKRRLKPEAIPSRNLPSFSRSSERTERMSKRTRKKIVHDAIVEYEIQTLLEVASNKNNSLATEELDNTTDVATQTKGNLESVFRKENEDLKKPLKKKTYGSIALKEQLQQESEFGLSDSTQQLTCNSNIQDQAEQEELSLSEFEEEEVEYIAGFVIKKLKLKRNVTQRTPNSLGLTRTQKVTLKNYDQSSCKKF